MKALSLHIGLNFIDPKHYDGWDGELAACEFDAKDMFALAKSCGFTPQILLRQKATAKAVITAISSAAAKLKAGDIFFVSYAGHGGQVPDINGDEGKFGDTHDRMDETWCLFDRQLIDDESAALWAKFAKGVRILVLSDSCHSGTVSRGPERRPAGRFRAMPTREADLVYRKHRGLYDAIQNSLRGSENEKIGASIILISGCMDNQLSRDGDKNGLFTETLKKVWENNFSGSYREFRETIAALMPPDQTPNYFVIGAPNKVFEKEQPFTISAREAGKKGKGIAKGKAAKPKAAAKKSVKPVVLDKELDAVLQALDALGYQDPRDQGSAREDSKIKTWFRAIDKADKAAALPEPQRLAQFIQKMKRNPRITLTAAALTGGKYATPRVLADLA